MKAGPTMEIDVPNDFPSESYQAVRAEVKSMSTPFHTHFAGGWNAVAYRYTAADKFNSEFVKAYVVHGDMPPPNQRFDQENALFGFFTVSCSVLDSAFFALYAILGFLKPEALFLTEEALRKVTPQVVVKTMKQHFANDPSCTCLGEVLAQPQLEHLRYMRNVLTHRVVPGRMAFVGGKKHQQTEIGLKGGVPFNETLTSVPREYLSRITADVVMSIEGFVSRHFVEDFRTAS